MGKYNGTEKEIPEEIIRKVFCIVLDIIISTVGLRGRVLWRF